MRAICYKRVNRIPKETRVKFVDSVQDAIEFAKFNQDTAVVVQNGDNVMLYSTNGKRLS